MCHWCLSSLCFTGTHPSWSSCKTRFYWSSRKQPTGSSRNSRTRKSHLHLSNHLRKCLHLLHRLHLYPLLPPSRSWRVTQPCRPAPSTTPGPSSSSLLRAQAGRAMSPSPLAPPGPACPRPCLLPPLTSPSAGSPCPLLPSPAAWSLQALHLSRRHLHPSSAQATCPLHQAQPKTSLHLRLLLLHLSPHLQPARICPRRSPPSLHLQPPASCPQCYPPPLHHLAVLFSTLWAFRKATGLCKYFTVSLEFLSGYIRFVWSSYRASWAPCQIKLLTTGGRKSTRWKMTRLHFYTACLQGNVKYRAL